MTHFRWIFVAIAAVSLLLPAACGTTEAGHAGAVSTAVQSPSPGKGHGRHVRPRCARAARDGARVYRVCAFFGSPYGESFITVTGGSGRTRKVAGAPPADPLTQNAGHWRDVWPSPDGEMLLSQWSGECEIPTAFFVDLHDGSMQVVTDRRDWTKAPSSEALGWRSDGLALVRLRKGLCGVGARRPGVYAIDPGGPSIFVHP
jgi:hypothetical protein